MVKNKIIFGLFSVLFCNSIMSGEKQLDRTIYPTNTDILNEKRLSRQEGYWTTESQLDRAGLWNGDREDLFAGVTVNSHKTEPTSKYHQRENWYELTKYIAEPFCTITNIPFLYVAYKFRAEKPIASAALAFAGTASAVSHAIPKHWLNVVNRVAAVAAVAGVAYDCNLFNSAVLTSNITNPIILMALITTGLFKYIDRELGNNQKWEQLRKKWHTPTHVGWHSSAAILAFVLLYFATQH